MRLVLLPHAFWMANRGVSRNKHNKNYWPLGPIGVSPEFDIKCCVHQPRVGAKVQGIKCLVCIESAKGQG
jgi:hypothetical protein